MNRTVPLKLVTAGIGAVVLLAGSFFAGMAYENHRIVSGIEDAFGGFDDDTGSGTEADVTEDVDYGEPAPFGDSVAWGDEGQWAVTATGLECDLPSIPSADYDDETYEEVDAVPTDGSAFCVVTTQWQNTGTAPAYLSMSDHEWGLLSDDRTEYGPTGEDSTYESAISPAEGSEVNPGDSGELKQVFSIRDDVEVDDLLLTDMFSEAFVLLATS